MFRNLISLHRRAIRPVIIQFVKRLRKEQQIEKTNKYSIKTCRKKRGSRKAIFSLKIFQIEPSSNAKKSFIVTFLSRIDKKKTKRQIK